jgi:hypothetical protein
MKKFFAFGLLLLLFAVAMSVAPTKAVPLDKDVGICYIAPMDQATDVVMYVADNSIISLPDPRSALLSGVEKSDYTITLNSQIDVQYVSLDLRQTTPAKMTNLQGSNSINRDLGGLLTEYVSPRDGAKSRHT